MTHAQNSQLLLASDYFDESWYLDTYPDVASSGMSAVEHFLMYGGLMQRDPGPDFKTAFYLRQYPDVAETGVNPLLHFLTFGEKEGRVPAP